MPNRREFDHMVNHNFKVEIEGVTVASFMEVSGLESVTEVVETSDGDDSLSASARRTGYSNIVLQRGFYRLRRAVEVAQGRD